jgi:integrase
MKLSLRYAPAAPAGTSPYRLVDHQDQDILWAKAFLDAQCIRQLSLRSLRAYAYDLLHFARWQLLHSAPTLLEMDESTVLQYVRDQLDEDPKPAPQTVNHRLGVLRSVYHFHSGHPLPEGPHHFHRSYFSRSSLGYGRSHRRTAYGLRLREPQHVIVPLSAQEVATFWNSFHTFRDLALIALMLLDGLRSQETLDLQL